MSEPPSLVPANGIIRKRNVILVTLALLLAVASFAVLCSNTMLSDCSDADSDDGFTDNGIRYEIVSGNNVKVIENKPKYSGSVTIPATVTYNSKTYNVISIDEEAFSECTSMTSVTIPNSVVSIGEEAFSECTALTSVNMGTGVKIIGGEAFSECTALVSIVIPDSVTTIGEEAFAECTALTSVNIPAGVSNIGEEAFAECTSLKSITVSEGNKNYCSDNGVLFNKNKTILIQYPSGFDTYNTYAIPNSVTEIGNYAFYGCTVLASVAMNNVITTIGENAFTGCTSLMAIDIPNTVKVLGEEAFYRCTSLSSVSIGNGVSDIDEEVFYGCTSLRTVNIGSGVRTIGEEAFYGCTSLETITIGSNVTTIDEEAFNSCTSLTSVNIPASVTSIGESAFSRCTELEAITVSSDNSKYCSDNGVLFNKSKSELIQYPAGKTGESYTVPSSVKSIGECAFAGCIHLKAISVANGNTKYTSENGVLFDKDKEELIQYPAGKTDSSYTIPSSVESICEDAFYGCSSLKEIIVQSGNKEYLSENGVLFDKNKEELIQYPAGKADSSYTVPNGVRSIGDYAFEDNKLLTEVIIPDSVREIGSGAFQGCTALVSVVIGNGLTDISKHAFDQCTSLRSLKIGSCNINLSVFYFEKGLSYISIGANATGVQTMFAVYDFYDADGKRISSSEMPGHEYKLSNDGKMVVSNSSGGGGSGSGSSGDNTGLIIGGVVAAIAAIAVIAFLVIRSKH